MQKVRVPLTNFAFGEVSPSLISRTDAPVYNQSAQRIENFFLRSEGGVVKRTGLEYIYEFDTVVDTSKKQQARLVPFIFSDDEQYIVSLEHQQVRVFRVNVATGAVSLTSTITADVDSNTLLFDDSQLQEYTFAQAGDIMFICHPTFVPQQLVRTSLTDFQVESFVFDQRSDDKVIYQPYYPFQTAGMTLDPSASTGNGITLTTSSDYWDTGVTVTAGVAAGSFVTDAYYKIASVGTTDFTAVGANSSTVGEIFKATGAGTGTGTADLISQPKHIGVTIRYLNEEIEITHVRTATVAVGNVQDSLKKRLSPDSMRTNNGSAGVTVTLVNHGMAVGDAFTMAEADTVGAISVNQLNGSRTVASVISNDQFVFNAGANANSSELGGGTPTITTHAATTSWSEQSYSALRGYPSAVTFHENRLVFAGTIAQPDSIWFSKTASYYNFDVGEAKDNEAIHLTAAVGEVQQIRHLVSNRDLQIFTASSEMYVPAFQNQPISPTNAQVRRQTPFGCGLQRPQVSDGSTIFIQKGNTIAREFVFSDKENAYIGSPISSLSSHLIKEPIEMTTLHGALNKTEDYIFLLNNDGTLAVFNSNKNEQRAGWVEFTCNGTFHSVCAVDDRVFAAVEFDVGDGTTKIILCEFKDGFNLDMAKDYTGTAGVFDVSGEFEDGAELHVIDGNNYVGKFTVASGNIDVSATDASLTAAQIGYSFDVELKTNPIDASLGNGPITGVPRGIGSVYVDLFDTLACTVNTTEMIVRTVVSPDMAKFSGKKEFRLIGYSRDPQVTITQAYPLDLQINGMVAELIF